MKISIQGVHESLRSLFDQSKTRAGSQYSPYVAEIPASFDALLHATMSCAHTEPDPLGSPLSSVPSTPEGSRPSSPDPDAIAPTTDPRMPPLSAAEPPLEELHSLPRLASSGPVQRKRCRKPTDPVKLEARRQSAKKRGHLHRQKRRHGSMIALSSKIEAIKQHLSKKSRHLERTDPFNHSFTPDHFTPTTSAFIGKKGEMLECRVYQLTELQHFEYVTFDPEKTRYIPSSDTGKIMCIVVPGSKDPSYQDTIQRATVAVETLYPECHFTQQNRRGPHNAVHYGISSGNGQKVPMMLNNQGVRNKRVMEKIRQHEAFIRISGLVTGEHSPSPSISSHLSHTFPGIFFTWAPLLFTYYVRIMSVLLTSDASLFVPFPNLVFAAFTLNFGPQTVCYPHRDTKNLAYGWCAITALGDFDWTKGGHLVLWDLRLVIEFPPGSTILIPSSVLCHLNTAIGAKEKRYSFTQFSAGALFRWVEHGFQKEPEYQSTQQAADNAARDQSRWNIGLNMFSTIEELEQGVSVDVL